MAARAKFGLAVPMKCLLCVGTNECTKGRHRTKMIRLQDPLRAMSRAHFRGIRDRYRIGAYSPMQRSDSTALTGQLKFLSMPVRSNIAAREVRWVIH